MRRMDGWWFALRCRSAAGLGVAVAVLAISAQSARAAFPGANGRIAFTVSEMELVLGPHPGYVETVWSKIETVLPSGHGRRSLRICPAGGCLPSDPTWSPDGKRLAFFTENRGALLWIINYNGTGDQTVLSFADGSWVTKVAWSPDGSQIAFDLSPQLVLNGWYSLLGDVTQSTIHVVTW